MSELKTNEVEYDPFEVVEIGYIIIWEDLTVWHLDGIKIVHVVNWSNQAGEWFLE